MRKGIIYNKFDCLDVLETLEDNTFSLIYVDIPEHIGTLSRRITYDESRRNPVAALCKERQCRLGDLKSEEIQSFIEECKKDRGREYEKYLFKIAQNCFRVLKQDGVIVYREPGGEPEQTDMGYILGCFFRKLETKVIEPISRLTHRNGFDLVHFYSNRDGHNFPQIYVLQPEDRYPYKDKKGKYRLLSMECLRNQNNFFVWNDLVPREGKGWRYSKEKLDELLKNDYIVIEKEIPKLKYYREEHPVAASPIWNDKNFLERAFELFVNKGDMVLGIYESLRFAYFAQKKGLAWQSVLPKDMKKTCFNGQNEIEGKYFLKDLCEEHEMKEYEIKLTLPIDIMKERTEFHKCISRECALSETAYEIMGTTTDEILIYHIYKYLNKEGITESEFSNICGVSRPTIDKMKKAVNRQKKQSEVEKSYYATSRDRGNIIRIAVYTQMSFGETRRALKASGHDFRETNPVDSAVVQWLCGDRKSIEVLNEMIRINCKEAGLPESKYENDTYTLPRLKGKEKRIASR